MSAAPALAQEAQSASVSSNPSVEEEEVGSIIVEGYTERQVRNFLWRAVIESGNAIAKRVSPICVGIDNAPEVLVQPLRQRITDNLRSLEIEVEEPGCRANAIVVFYSDPHAFVNWLDSNHSHVFNALYLPEKRRLIRPVRSVYSWHFIGAEAEVVNVRDNLRIRNSEGDSTAGGFDNPGGRILPQQPADSSHSFTVIDIDEIDGLTIEQLGDYLTMQMLVEWRPGRSAQTPGDSILTLFSDEGANPDAPLEMSRMDRVILGEIYDRSRGSFRAAEVRSAIARATLETLDEEGILLASDEE